MTVAGPGAGTDRDAERVLGTFPGGSVVQLVRGDPAAGDALVVPLLDASISVTSRRVVAQTDDEPWTWLVGDLEHVLHGPSEPWTVLGVPGVSGYGVAVLDADRDDFRQLLASLTPRPDPAPVEAEAHPLPTEVRALRVGVPELPDPVLAPVHLREDDAPAHDRVSVDPTEPIVLGDVLTSPRPPVEVEPEIPHAVVAAQIAPEVATGAVPALEAREISAWFGSHHVLDRCSLHMHAGHVTALIGPSGCGKSTFLRILNRMHEMIPSAALAGEVRLDGEDIYSPKRRLTEARRQIGMVFQKPNPFPAMSIYDNVVASFRLTGTKLSQADKDDVVETCLSKAGLWNEVRDRLRQPGGGLSGGQQQRLCIARALAIRPRVLLMDEPCSALDPTSTRRIEQTITELADEVTIVIVTHNMQQAARVSHQCAFFLAEQGTPGVIVEHGPTDAMFNRPQDPRTFDYVNGRFG